MCSIKKKKIKKKYTHGIIFQKERIIKPIVEGKRFFFLFNRSKIKNSHVFDN